MNQATVTTKAANSMSSGSKLAASVGFSLLALFAAPRVSAADFFVAPAEGVKLSGDQADRITRMVRQSVRNMPEHNLVESDEEADFVLYPSIIQRDSGNYLRIEKKKDSELISVSEQSFDMDMRGENAQNVTQVAIQTDSFVAASDLQSPAMAGRRPAESDRVFNDGGTVSGTTSSAGEAAANMSGAVGGNMNSGAVDSRSFHDMNAIDSEPMTPGPQLNTADLRAPSPRIADGKVPGFFQVGFGPSLAMGLDSDNLLSDINVGYNYNLNERVTTKASGDFNLGLGGNAGQFINLSGGAEYYPVTNQKFTRTKPYITGDAGYGFARNGETHAAGSGVTVGGGAGFKFTSEQLNWDINAHYTLLTNTIEGQNPSVVGVRAALNF